VAALGAVAVRAATDADGRPAGDRGADRRAGPGRHRDRRSRRQPFRAAQHPRRRHRRPALNIPEKKYAHTQVPERNGRPSAFERDKSDNPPFLHGTSAHHTLAEGQTLRTGRLRTLLSVDDAMRDFRDKLRSLGQRDNTLVLYTSDHGLLWADHGWRRKSVPYRPSLEMPFYLSRHPGHPARRPLAARHPGNGGEVLFHEYYDLRADPYQLANRLHGASAEQERRLGVPEPGRRLTAARAT
jgi:arylsulfatase A-like enzyme